MINKIARKVDKKLINQMRNQSQQKMTNSSEEEIKVDV
jgi:hypothetical protein